MKMSKQIIVLQLFFFTTFLFSQNIKKESDVTKTKLELATLKKGVVTKYTDYSLEGLKATGIQLPIETKIRKVKSGIVINYFYQIRRQLNNSTASIEYSDLIELIKVLKDLKTEFNADGTEKSDYLENKFVTSDGFQIGYFIDKSKNSWYIKLHEFGEDEDILKFDNIETLETAFNNAKVKIDELKK